MLKLGIFYELLLSFEAYGYG